MERLETMARSPSPVGLAVCIEVSSVTFASKGLIARESRALQDTPSYRTRGLPRGAGGKSEADSSRKSPATKPAPQGATPQAASGDGEGGWGGGVLVADDRGVGEEGVDDQGKGYERVDEAEATTETSNCGNLREGEDVETGASRIQRLADSFISAK